MNNDQTKTAPANVSQLFPQAAADAPALQSSNAEVQLTEMIALHGPDATAHALVEWTATIEDSNFPQAVLNTHIKQCLEAGADAEAVRVLAQSKIDADYYHVDNVARLSSLVTCVRGYMSAHNLQVGTLEQRVA